MENRVLSENEAVSVLFGLSRKLSFTLNKTKVQKLLFFFDYEHVEKTGIRATSIEWKWHHYGPFCEVLEREIQAFVDTGQVKQTPSFTWSGAVEYVLEPLVDMSLPSNILENEQLLGTLHYVVRTYASLTATQLRDLTYKTDPMQIVQTSGKRGDIIDFGKTIPFPMPSEIRKVLDKYAVILQNVENEDELEEETGVASGIDDWYLQEYRLLTPLISQAYSQAIGTSDTSH